VIVGKETIEKEKELLDYQLLFYYLIIVYAKTFLQTSPPSG